MTDANIENQILNNAISNVKKAGIRLAKDVDRNVVRKNVVEGLAAPLAIQNSGKDNVIEDNIIK